MVVVVSSGMNTVTVSVVVSVFFSSFFFVFGWLGKIKENKLVKRSPFFSDGGGSLGAGASVVVFSSWVEGFGGG